MSMVTNQESKPIGAWKILHAVVQYLATPVFFITSQRDVRCLSLCYFVFGLSPSTRAEVYRVIDLGFTTKAIDYFENEANGLNNHGIVVGGGLRAKLNYYGSGQAFIWNQGQIHRIAYVAGGSRGLGINNHGDIVGDAILDPADHNRVPFSWSNNTLIFLPIPDGFDRGAAYSVNDAGQMVGSISGPYPRNHAAIWENGNVYDLGFDISVYCCPERMDINNHGQVVGSYRTAPYPTFDSHAFIWDQGVIQDLGTLGGRNSYARAINDLGQVVGRSELPAPTPSGQYHAFLLENNRMIDLGTLGGTYSVANDINDDGLIVGESQNAWNSRRAVLWKDGRIIDLNDKIPPGFTGIFFTEATAINDLGQILVEGCRSHHEGPICHPYWFKPIFTDCDDDGDVDYGDATSFAWCLDGPGQAAIPECRCTDIDGDDDTDLRDVQEFQNAFHPD